MYWKLAYFKGVLMAFVAFQVTLQTSTANLAWNNLGMFEQAMIIGAALGSAATVLIGFLDKTMARLHDGKPPNETGNTEFLKKQNENG